MSAVRASKRLNGGTHHPGRCCVSLAVQRHMCNTRLPPSQTVDQLTNMARPATTLMGRALAGCCSALHAPARCARQPPNGAALGASAWEERAAPLAGPVLSLCFYSCMPGSLQAS